MFISGYLCGSLSSLFCFGITELSWESFSEEEAEEGWCTFDTQGFMGLFYSDGVYYYYQDHNKRHFRLMGRNGDVLGHLLAIRSCRSKMERSRYDQLIL